MDLGTFDFTPDKRDHAAYGLAIAGCAVALQRQVWPDAPKSVRILWPILVATSFAIGKELADERNPDRHNAEWADVAYTVAPAAALTICLDWRF